MIHHNRQSAAALLASATTLALLSSAAAAEWKIEPRVNIDVQHSDNFQLFIDDAREDSLIANTIQGEVKAEHDGERNRFTALLGGGYSTYSGSRELDDTDRQYASLSYRRRVERGAFGVSGQFRRDDLLRRPRLVADLGDPDSALDDLDEEVDLTDVDPNLDLNNAIQQITRSFTTLKTFAQYRLNERQRLRIGYNFNDRNFDVPESLVATGISPRENEQHSVQARFTNRLSPRSQWSLSGRANALKADTIDTVRTYEANVGWQSQLTETAVVSAEIGATRTSGAERNRTGFTMRLAGAQRLSWGTITGQASRAMRPGISGNVTETDNAEISVGRSLSGRWSLGLTAQALQRDRSSSGLANDNFKLVSVGPTIAWTPMPGWLVSTSYQYRWVERSQETFDGSGTDHAVFLRLTYQPTGITL